MDECLGILPVFSSPKQLSDPVLALWGSFLAPVHCTHAGIPHLGFLLASPEQSACAHTDRVEH